MSATDQRPGLGLGPRLFLLVASLIVLSVGAAVAVTAVLSQRVAREAIDRSLDASARNLEQLQGRRQTRLLDNTYLVASDAYAVAYVAEAASGGDRNSLFDYLGSLQAELGFDFAALLDPDGRLLARTDRPQASGDDLSGAPLVAELLASSEATGLWREDETLFDAAAVPMVRGVDLMGYLIVAFRLRDQVAREIQAISGAEVVLAVRGDDGGLAPVAGTLDPEATVRALAALAALPGAAGDGEPARLELGNEVWLARASDLSDPAGGAVGVAFSLASLERQLAPYRRIRTALLASGAVSVLLAFALTALLGRGIVRPVRRLAAAATAARDGDYSHPISVERRDEVGQLARAFADLLRELRERREMEAYVSELSRNLPEESTDKSQPARPATTAEGSVLALELLRRDTAAADPEPLLDDLGRQLDRAAAAVRGRGGEIELASGARLLARFHGGDHALRALAAASDALRGWRAGVAAAPDSMPTAVMPVTGEPGERTPHEPAAEPTEQPLAAIASGSLVIGSVLWGGEAKPVVLGPPLRRLESLLREAAPGEILLSREVRDRLQTVLEEAGASPSERTGLTSAIPIFALPARTAPTLSLVLGTAAVATPAESRGQPLPQLGPGSVVAGRYEILGMLGAGGMGVVFRARDRELGDVVALKVLRREADDVEGLKEELRLARKVTHPNVLRTFDYGVVDGTPFLSMEYIRGITLRTLLDQTDRLPFAAALRIARQICAGLTAVHEMGVAHLDIKPENVILEPTGNAKLMDFGIARRLRWTAQQQTGKVVGTPGYLAPEQLRGERVDHRADIYACGVVFYELFTAEQPFPRTDSLADLLSTVLNDQPTPPSRHWPEIPKPLEGALLRCLAKVPDERFPQVVALQGELQGLGV